MKKWIIYQWKAGQGLANGNYTISYSQQAEDLHIERFFKDKSNGFYVDIGAFDPIIYSNTYKFYLKGWRGINIEANPDQIQKIKDYRPGDIVLNIAISDVNEELSYYRFDKPALNSFNIQHVDAWANREGFNQVDILKVKTRLLSDVLDEYLPAGTKIDFMSVDVEGWDLKVLCSNNWDKYRPVLLLVEFELNLEAKLIDSPLFSFLYTQGYRIWAISGGTAFFTDSLNKTI